MRIVEINASNYGSTGTIMLGVADALRQSGHQVLICYPATKRNLAKNIEGTYIIGSRVGRNICLLLSKLTGREDLLFRVATFYLLRQIDRFSPDIIHLHNIHGWYVNFTMLFNYIKRRGIRVIWTFHDCWPLTGHCPHFDMVGCDKWKTSCFDCTIYRDYPYSRIDNSAKLHTLKKNAFLGVKDLIIVTPSMWLADIVSQSFLNNYMVKVIYNGIDLDIFKPTSSEFRSHYNCQDKKLLLGVAFGWTKRKGLDVFIRLAHELDNTYQIVLVGTDPEIDTLLPKNILSIHRTHSQKELAQIYTTADVLVNPTREEVLGLVNIEALACGTPVLTFRTGGSPETIDGTCGCIIEKNDYMGIKQSIIDVCDHPLKADSCRGRSQLFSKEKMVERYKKLILNV